MEDSDDEIVLGLLTPAITAIFTFYHVQGRVIKCVPSQNCTGGVKDNILTQER
jgi:hypothetical protein